MRTNNYDLYTSGVDVLKTTVGSAHLLEEDVSFRRISEERKREAEELLAQYVGHASEYIRSFQSEWIELENMVNGKHQPRTYRPFEDAACHAFPLVQPKIDAMVNYVTAPLVQADQYYSVRLHGYGGESNKDLENFLHYFLANGNYEETVQAIARNAAIFGRAPFIVTLEVETTKKVYSQEELQDVLNGKELEGDFISAALRFRPIHPLAFIIYPLTVRRISDAKVIGHRFVRMAGEIDTLYKMGVYDISSEELQASSVTSLSYMQYADVSAITSTSERSGKPCMLAQVLFRHDFDGKGEKWYVGTYAPDSRRLLRFREYPFTRPWYGAGALTSWTDGFFPPASEARKLMSLQVMYDDINNLLINGAYMSAFPAIFGHYLGTGNVSTEYAPGALVPVDTPASLTVVSGSFNPQGLLLLKESIERAADKVVSLSDPAVGAPLPGRRTATEMAYLAQGLASGVESRTRILGSLLAEGAEFGLRLLSAYRLLWERWLGDKFAGAISVLDLPVKLEPSARSLSSTPSGRVQAMEIFARTALATPAASMVKWDEFLKRFAKLLDISSPESVMLTPEEMAQMQILGGGVPQGVPQGLPEEEETVGQASPATVGEALLQKAMGTENEGF